MCLPCRCCPTFTPLVDKLYKPYDIGQVGQLDVHILTGIFGGETAARDFTPAWDGGIYWAGQLGNATTAQQATTGSIALLYLSAWKSSASAQAFASLYARDLGRKYSGLKPDSAAQRANEQVFTTSEGPVVITTRGKLVFVSESFDLELAHKLATLVLDAQGTGETKFAGLNPRQNVQPAQLQRISFNPSSSNGNAAAQAQLLTGSMVRFLSDCGVMKVAVDAAYQSIR